jgi:predicted NodU family carbamoyl transferase
LLERPDAPSWDQLLQPGHRLVAFAEEEMLNRERHQALTRPGDRVCLHAAGIGMADVEVVAFAHRPGLDLVRGMADALRRRAPRRLAVQAYVDANLVHKTAA